MKALVTFLIMAVVAAGLLSLFTSFKLSSGFQKPTPPVNVVHTRVITERPPTAHWLPPTGQAGGHLSGGRPVHPLRIVRHILHP